MCSVHYKQLLTLLLLVSTAVVATSQTKTSQQADDTKPSAAANYFPNLLLLTQDSKRVRFYDDMLKDKVVLINVMFSTCEGVCPPMTANLTKVQRLLASRVGKEVHMISITVDPIVDTPAVLKKYANRFGVQAGWYFLTGEKQNVDQVLKKLGAHVQDKNSHNSILIIGKEATGEWMKMYAIAKPADIASSVLKLLESP